MSRALRPETSTQLSSETPKSAVGRRLWGWGSLASLASLTLLVGACSLVAESVTESVAEDLTDEPLEEEIFPEMSIGSQMQEPVEIPVNITDLQPGYTLDPNIDTSAWGYLIHAHNLDVQAGLGEGFSFDASGLEYVSDSPVNFVVTVGSRNNQRAFVPPAAQLAALPVAACAFTLPASAGGDPLIQQQFGANMSACFSQWVATNGIPEDFFYSIMSSAEVGGVGQRQLGEYKLSGTKKLVALRNSETRQWTHITLGHADINALTALFENRDIASFRLIGLRLSGKWNPKLPTGLESPTCVQNNLPLSVRGFGSLDRVNPDDGGVSLSFNFTLPQNVDAFFRLFMERDTKPVEQTQGGFSTLAVTSFPTDKKEFLLTTLDIVGEHLQALADGLPEDTDITAGMGTKIPVRGGYVVNGTCPREGFVKGVFGAVPKFVPNSGDDSEGEGEESESGGF